MFINLVLVYEAPLVRSFCAVGMSVTVVHGGSGSRHQFTGGKLLPDY